MCNLTIFVWDKNFIHCTSKSLGRVILSQSSALKWLLLIPSLKFRKEIQKS